MKSTEEKFASIFKYMGLPKDQVRPEASLITDFEFEEFQFKGLVFYLESYFRINIRGKDYFELDTIGSTMDFVRMKLSKRDQLKISRREILSVKKVKLIPVNFHKRDKGLVFSYIRQRALLSA